MRTECFDAFWAVAAGKKISVTLLYIVRAHEVE